MKNNFEALDQFCSDKPKLVFVIENIPSWFTNGRNQAVITLLTYK